MHIQRAIEKLGYTKSEAKVYVVTLRLGEAMISEIAERSEIPRTSVQVIITKLQKKGLLNAYVKRKRKYWVAENPKKFILDAKEQETIAQSIFPELKRMRHKTQKRPGFEFYSGRKRIKLIFEDVILTKHPVLIVGPLSKMITCLGEDVVVDFFDKIFERNLTTELITTKLVTATKRIKLPKKTAILSSNFDGEDELSTVHIVYDNKASIITLNEKEPIGVIFDDAYIAETTRLFFRLMWEQASSNHK